MVNWQKDGVRLTHLPTGTVAVIGSDRASRPGNARFRIAWAYDLARLLLAAKLCRPAESANPRRSYHVDPPLGLDPFIEQGGRVLARGRQEVGRFLDGAW